MFLLFDEPNFTLCKHECMNVNDVHNCKFFVSLHVKTWF